jgi:heme/copper-type cytochrome/quinol oxidase subunit 2
MSARISKPILILVVLSLILGGAALAEGYMAYQQSNTPKPATGTRTIYMEVIPDMGGPTYDKFYPQTITVQKGDTVKIILNNTDTMDHSFNLDAYNIAQTVHGGQTVTIQFVADQAGIFEYYCNVPCGAGHLQMRGQLTVLG